MQPRLTPPSPQKRGVSFLSATGEFPRRQHLQCNWHLAAVAGTHRRGTSHTDGQKVHFTKDAVPVPLRKQIADVRELKGCSPARITCNCGLISHQPTRLLGYIQKPSELQKDPLNQLNIWVMLRRIRFPLLGGSAPRWGFPFEASHLGGFLPID